MSAITTSTEAAAPFDDETPTVNVRYSFKVTEENKTRSCSVSLNDDLIEFTNEMVARSARWRSFGQLMNDAIIFYLDGGDSEISAPEMIETARWDSDHRVSFNVTSTLYKEIKLMVNHSHTAWNTMQEFFICSLFAFISNDLPVIRNLR